MDCHRAVTTSLFWFICWLLDPSLGKRLTTSVGVWGPFEGGVLAATISMAAFLAV